MNAVRLRALWIGADFRFGEVALIEEFRKKKRPPLQPGDAYLFVSRGLNQMLWVTQPYETDGFHGAVVKVYDTRRWRIIHGSWSPQMMSKYAEAVKLRIENVKTFEEQYAEWKAGKSEAA